MATGIHNLLFAAEILERNVPPSGTGKAEKSSVVNDSAGGQPLRKRRVSQDKPNPNGLDVSSSSSPRNVDRVTHNQLEKNRRANLRHCLDELKSLVPLGPDCTRHTTVSLLTRSRLFIKSLEDTDAALVREKQRLGVRQAKLKRRLEVLLSGGTTEDESFQDAISESPEKRPRSNSESSASTISATEIADDRTNVVPSTSVRTPTGPLINATFTFGSPVKSKGALKVMVNDRVAQTSTTNTANPHGKVPVSQPKKERKLKRPHKAVKDVAEVLDLSVKRVAETPQLFPPVCINNPLAAQHRSAGAESHPQFHDPYLLLSELLKIAPGMTLSGDSSASKTPMVDDAKPQQPDFASLAHLFPFGRFFITRPNNVSLLPS